MIPIGLMNQGEKGEIAALRLQGARPATGAGEERAKCDCRIEDMGLRIGKEIEVLSNAGAGAVLLKVDDSRIAIDRGLAMKIMVKEVKQ